MESRASLQAATSARAGSKVQAATSRQRVSQSVLEPRRGQGIMKNNAAIAKVVGF